MTREQKIYELTRSGELTEYYKLGLVDYKLLMYRDIYYDYQKEITVNRKKKLEAARIVAERFRVDLSTVYRARKFLTT